MYARGTKNCTHREPLGEYTELCTMELSREGTKDARESASGTVLGKGQEIHDTDEQTHEG